MADPGKDIKTFRVLLSGRVQGVGFRYFTQDVAKKYCINGYVSNISGNKVEVICQGRKNDLDLFISSVKKGPSLSYIIEFILEEINDLSLYDSFEIKY